MNHGCTFQEEIFFFPIALLLDRNKEFCNKSVNLAASEGSIPLEEGEELWLIETDQGDGWTR